MNVQFNLKAKYVVAGVLLATGIAYFSSNKPVEYEFSSVYDGNQHHVLVYTDSNNKRYNERCADDVAKNMLKANLGKFNIEVVQDGEYELIYYNGNKVK